MNAVNVRTRVEISIGQRLIFVVRAEMQKQLDSYVAEIAELKAEAVDKKPTVIGTPSEAHTRAHLASQMVSVAVGHHAIQKRAPKRMQQ